MQSHIYNTAILGAGAAGLFCAANLPGTDKIIIEHNKAAGLKIIASGGGNCNFSNAKISWQDYYGANPRFCASALAGFTSTDFTDILKTKHIAFEQRQNGQLFAFGARSILDMLYSMINPANTRFEFNTNINTVTKNNDIFEIDCYGKVFLARNVVVALGGKSYAKLGASECAYKIARSFGIHVTQLYPALTGLVFGDDFQSRFAVLAGLSCCAKISSQKHTLTGDLLFTHEGLSGPTVFKLSLYGLRDGQITVNLLPGTDVLAFLNANKTSIKKVSNLLEAILTPRLAAAIAQDFTVKLADAKKADIQKLAAMINAMTFKPKGTCGYDKAEITAGGIDTKYISSKTMQAQGVEGLFFTGECLDVSGQLGGFNLHWAWASGFAAAKAIQQKADI